MTSTITILGLPELEKKLGRLASIDLLKPPMHKATKLIYAETQKYPPPRPGQTYVRRKSAGLAGSWVERVEIRGKTLVGVVGSSISYGPFVQSPDKQAWMHKGRWPTTDDITKKVAKPVSKLFENAIRKAIDD